MLAKIEKKLQKKADKLAKAALEGKKVRKLKAKIAALTEEAACLKFYEDSKMDSSLGECVATKVTSRRRGRRLLAENYDTELIMTEDEISVDALQAAEAALVASGAEGVTSAASVDPIEELKVIPGVEADDVATFEAQADEVVALSPAPAPPTSAPPPPTLEPAKSGTSRAARFVTAAVLAASAVLLA